MRVVFAGGGTGGHLYPGLAIARELVKRDPAVRPFFVGALRGIERDVLPKAEFPHLLLDLHPLYRPAVWQNWRTIRGAVNGWRQIGTMVAEERPALVVGTGGYAAGLMLAYSVVHRLPIVQQAGDSHPGITARGFSRWSREIYLSFPEAGRILRAQSASSLIDTGAPIEPPPSPRPNREAAREQWGFPRTGGKVLLIYGGSQGSLAINSIVAEWIGRGLPKDLYLIWATGRGTYDQFKHLDSPTVRVRDYLAPIADAYAASDLALTRAGAMTTSELFAWGIPGILIPLPTAAADHQTANARALEAAGAAIHLPQANLSAERLGRAITGVLESPKQMADLAANAARRARPRAASVIAERIIALLYSGGRTTASQMPLLDSHDNRPVHFVGIAGAGMSALAELFVRRGVVVTGCDMNPTGAADLERLGVRVTTHDPSHVNGARALVVTSAMPKDHPELVRARERGVPVIRRAEALGEVTVGRELVGIAGTHGKTTTTVMTTAALTEAGRNPTALVGGRVAAWEGNLRAGGDTLYVVEADEYDRSFLALTPTVAVVTNVEADHLDIYKDLDDIRDAFAQFAKGARAIVLCGDDRGASSLPTPSATEVIRYGIDSRDARLVARDLRTAGRGSSFDVVYDGEMLGGVVLEVPGRHNVLNALGAIAAGIALGAPFDGLARGLGTFHGVERRFQRLGEAGGVSVIDDYAHHPTEIAATLAAARGTFPGRRIIAAFQPHLYTRTRDFSTEFGAALAAADAVFLTEIYPAREQPIEGVSASLIEKAIEKAGGKLAWRGERSALASALAKAVKVGDVVITIGAGDITKTGPELLARLGQR